MKLISIIAVTSILCGCSTYFKKSYISIAIKMNKLLVRSLFGSQIPVLQVILNDPDGTIRACMQTALAIKTTDSKGEATISEAILNLSKTAASVSTSQGTSSEKALALAELSGSIKQTANILTTTTERTAFLNMGLFYICQLSANKSISESTTLQLTSELIKQTVTMHNKE
ncbi:hypothetical protein [Pseudoalteromonas rhizosphaerae]|uniref:hypothetical protein n=1 Tax=Pseudoalteromonas rhizosphaerae TaxID=2518973 RepID=UPI0021474193|nr:hypothetical protein [Pseudoalteromonas rhizosphaerae]